MTCQAILLSPPQFCVRGAGPLQNPSQYNGFISPQRYLTLQHVGKRRWYSKLLLVWPHNKRKKSTAEMESEEFVVNYRSAAVVTEL